MTSNGSAAYTYDAENRLTSSGGCTFTYDGDGERVEKTGCGSIAYWRDLGGNTLEEASTSGTMSREYVFFNGQRIARRDVSTNNVFYFFSDHLGSTSLVTNSAGAMPPQMESDYYPYGGEIQITTGIQDQNYKFTGKERDSVTGLDYFGARYDSSSLGRFMTPDWAAKPTTVPYAVFGNPQTLNLYAYVQNDPISRADADGHTGCMNNPPTSCFGINADNNRPPTLSEEQAAASGAPEPPVKTQKEQPLVAQNTTQTQTQQKPGEEHKGEPYSLKPEGSKPTGNNGQKIFTYQVVDPSGRPVRDVSVQEHIKTVVADNAEAVPNPNPVHYPTGQVRDQIGPQSPPGNEHSFLKTEQTFTATKGGRSYEMSTKTNQYVDTTNGRVTVQVVILVP